MKSKKIILLIFLHLLSISFFAQNKEGIIITKQLKTTPVKNQNNTGTCWSFATTSFVETEILRKGGVELNLSEMYFVYYSYLDKADKFVRMHGKANFSQGGQAHDVMNVIQRFGFVTEDFFPGLNYGLNNHDHTELEELLSSLVKTVVKSENPTTAWRSAFEGVLKAYLGELPAKIKFNEKEYSPIDFSKTALKFNPEEYVEITSYNYRPFYQQVELDVPDNWSHGLYYNLPLAEAIQTMKSAIENGYSVCWDGDVSEKEFSHRAGLATYTEPLNVTEAMRQQVFDNYQTTDDHLMHLTGLAKDNKEQVFFQTKNSWSADSNNFGGYLYMSEDFVSLNTVAFLVHKDALSKELKKKLGIK